VLDQPEGTVRSHMHRGLCALRELLEGRLGQDG
jgi:DNA-directed RNA polymerase specialized sigma24 family protein